MNRRNFLAASVAAGTAATIPAAAEDKNRNYFELIRYELVNNAQRKQLETYWEKAAIPALNRLGIDSVGVLKSKFGSHGLDVYVLIPHKTLDSFATTWDQIAHDPVYQEQGQEFLQTEMNQPAYYRFETSLLHAFAEMSQLEVPEHIQGKSSRLFEVRIYESHNRHKAQLKIEMFNAGGEIALFRETGLHPVMFAETLAGRKMPNLTYILGFENMEEHDRNWDVFRNSEGWQKMRDLPRYKDTVSSVTDLILTPAECSQM